MADPAAELARVRALLGPIEEAAASLPWAEREPWRVATHVGHDGLLVGVDLHRLPARLARDAVRALVAEPPEVGVVWVHGRGGTRGKTPGVLAHVVRGELGPLLAERGWSLDPHGPRTIWLTDPARGPAAGTSWLLVGVGALLLFALVLTLTRPWWDG